MMPQEHPGPLMARDPFATEDPPALQDVLDALEDGDCRDIIESLEEPMTANAVADASGVPLSTTYRKLNLLSEASLVREAMDVRRDGQHATTYEVDFEAVEIALDERRELGVEIARPRTPEERLASMWSEVRKET